MIPGTVSKLSHSVIASTTSITPLTEVVEVTGTEAIETITVPLGVTDGKILFLIPDAAFTLTTTGNISIAATAVAGKVLILVWCPETGKWNPSYA